MGTFTQKLREFKRAESSPLGAPAEDTGSLRLWFTRRPGIEKVRLNVRRYGLANTLYDLTLRTANSVVLCKVLRGVSIERVEPEFLNCPGKYTPRFLSESLIRDLARSPENEMPEGFVEEALGKGDECYGICDGDRLAAYGWYSHKPTRMEPSDLLLHFNDEYVYMYKGFTHERYRGERLHAIGMTMALKEYLAKGFKGLVSYVESNNFSSLKSCFRMGYIQFGSVYVVKVFGRYASYRTGGCDKFGFWVEQLPSAGSLN